MDALTPYVSEMNIDLKAFSEKFYKEQCKAKLTPVLDSIRQVHQRGIWLEITTLVIPSLNDSDEELGDIAGFIASVDREIPWHISAFHPAYRMKDASPTSRKALRRAYEIGREKGLRHIYLGNIRDERRSTTWCPGCGLPLIRRSGYFTRLESVFQDGRCANCKTKIPGVWS